MKSIVTAADMRLMSRLFHPASPGELPLSFEYDGRTYRGMPSPCTVRREAPDSRMVRHTVCAQPDETLRIRVEVTEYLDFPAVEILAFFENPGRAPSKRLKNVRVVDAALPVPHPLLIHGNGDTCQEDGYEWFRDPVDHPITMSPGGGFSCFGAFPYFRLMGEDFGVNIAVGWPASWSCALSPDGDATRISIGQARFDMVLCPGETMRTPRATFVAFTGSETRGTNMWRRWYSEHILPQENGAPLPPKCCMHTFRIGGHPEFTGITEENQISGIRDYVNSGVHPDVWWIDAGWYACDYDWPHLGTWRPDPERLPRGLEPVGRECEAQGMELLLWFEPERACADSEIARLHPEWLLSCRREDGTPATHFLVNLGDPDCCDWITDRVDSVIREGHVRIYRQDCNFYPGMDLYWEQAETPERVGAPENLHVQGYLRLWDTLLARNPGLLIDSCAGGGRRNDLETMRRAVPFHYTDVGYGNHPIKQKQHRQMFAWIPYFRAHNQSWDNPDGSYGYENRPVDEFAYEGALAPALTDMTEHDAPPEAMELARRMQALWRRAAGIMLDADYYPLTECRKSARDYYAMQFHNPDTDRGFFQILRNTQVSEPEFAPRLESLADGVYELERGTDGRTITADADTLRRGALSFALSPRRGEVWFYKKL